MLSSSFNNSFNVFQIFEFLLLRILFRSVSHFLSRIIWYFVPRFLSSLYILEINPLSDMGLVKIFFHSVGCCFVLFVLSFALQKLLSFRRSHLLIVALSVHTMGVIFRKWFFVPMHSRLLLNFSSIRFSITGFILRSLESLGLSFVHGDSYGSICNLLHVDI